LGPAGCIQLSARGREESKARPGESKDKKQCRQRERERQSESQDFSWMLAGLEDSVYNCAPC